MMKKLTSILLALVMALTLCSTAWADGPSWYDENVAVFELNSADQLAELATLVNESEDQFSGKTVKLTANIDLSSVASWTPIGNGARSSSHYSGKAFKGTFDGDNHTISGVNNMLFGVLDGGTIKNLNIVADINNTTADSVGAAVGVVVNGGTVENITVSGSVKSTKSVGGVVGRVLIEGTVKDCVNSAAITTSGTTNAGGIVGAAYYTEVGKAMTISGCSNSGTVTSGYAAGGIVGFSAADVKNCVNTGAISAGNEAGGIVGEQTNYGTVSGNNNSGTVSNNGGGSSYGGIVGWVRYQKNTSAYPNTTMIEVSDNINSGTVSASGASLGAGGIVGTAYNQALVTGNTNTAANIAGGAFAAGILGGAQMSVRGEADEGNVVLEGQTITVSNNVSTTAKDSITGKCATLYVWINDPAFSETGNVNHIYTVTINGADGETGSAKIEVGKDFTLTETTTGTTTAASAKFNGSAATAIATTIPDDATDVKLTVTAKAATESVVENDNKAAYTTATTGVSTTNAVVVSIDLTATNANGATKLFTEAADGAYAIVTVPYKTGMKNVTVKHLGANGEVNTLTAATNADLTAAANNSFYYDSANGVITLRLEHFSQYLINGSTSGGSSRPIYSNGATAADAVKDKAESPKTFDAGIAVYGVMAVSSVLGMGYVGKKKF